MSDQSKIKDVVKAYIEIRAIRLTNKKEFDDKDKELKALQDSLEGHAIKMLEEQGLDSVKTEHGTLYTTVSDKFSVKDRDALDQYVLKSGRIDIFGNTLNKDAVLALVEEHGGELPAGVRQYSVKNARFNAPKK